MVFNMTYDPKNVAKKVDYTQQQGSENMVAEDTNLYNKDKK